MARRQLRKQPRPQPTLEERLAWLETQMLHNDLPPEEEQQMVEQVIHALDRLGADDSRWRAKLAILGERAVTPQLRRLH